MSVWEDVAMAQAIEAMAQLNRKTTENEVMRYSREEQLMREWEKYCLCPHPFDPEDCTCGALDAYCPDCDQWDWCRCRTAEQRSDAFREEGR